MAIRNKIIYGYALTLSLALGGTTIGLFVGNYYQKKALEYRQIVSQERKLISTLQVDILYNRPAKQLSPHLQNPEIFRQESTKLIQRVDKIGSLLQKNNMSGKPAALEELQPLLEEYELSVRKFAQKAQTFAQKVQPLTSTPTGATEAQTLLVRLVKSPEFVDFIEFPDRLQRFSELAEQREEEAENELLKAETLRTQIIVLTSALSVAITILLAIYISRSIARPIQSLTNVAQKVTQESNFDLQASVETKDEVSVLANSLNRLILRVKQLLEEQKEYTEQLQQAIKDADSANQAKSKFLATMSHELRTPLHAILGFSRILSENPAVQAGIKEIDIIRHSGDHLLELINDVLTMSKIEAGHIALHNYNFDLFELLSTLQDMLEFRADEKGLDLNFELAEDVPQYIHGDGQKLRQVLLNLLGNGIKFTTQGYVSLMVSSCCRLLPPSKSAASDKVSADCLSIRIEDTGSGIAPEEIPLLFQPFSQTQTGVKTKEGTGLGLAISQRLVQLMGGQLQVSSILNQGTIFSFEIACIPVDLKQIEKKHSNQPVLGLLDGQPPYRILVVDDRPTNRELVRGILEPVGLDIRDVDNGQEAISIWQNWHPHLIWMDMRMPVMSGYEATQAIRAIEAEQGIEQRTKIIALTASVFDENRKDILASGCDDLVHKPFTPETLFCTLAEHLGIKYVYSESIKSIELNTALQDLSPDHLPVEWLKQLYQLAYEADGQGIQALIEELPPDQSAWKITLSKWIDDFRFDAIIDLVLHFNAEYDQQILSKKHPHR